MADSKKKLTKAVAVATAAALLLGGTFAWQSISQTALNEASDVINPGGRLHDDFYIDADGNYNSDIYVENFADDEIFARVRLEEYFEIVTNKGLVGANGTLLETVHTVAGSKTLKDGAVADPVNNPTGANLYDYEYVTHYFDQENTTDEYWTLTPGDVDSETVYYMPTFNKNKDSLVPDRNGMYVDRVGGISDQSPDQYEDYYVWSDGEESIDNAIYDADSNMDDEVKENFDDLSQYVADGNIVTTEETHNAQAVGTSNGLISMSEWQDMLANDEPTGEYWVYDEDGWVYWTSPIAKDSATGLLLDSISLNKVMDDSWYYALNVIGQFVTANDLGSEEDGTGFYDTTDGPAPTENALALLEAIGVDVTGEAGGDDEEPYGFSHMLLSYNPGTSQSDTLLGDGYLSHGDFVDFGVVAYYNNGETIAITEDNVQWNLYAEEGTLADDTSLDQNGDLTVSESQEPLSVIRVEAVFTDKDGYEHSRDMSLLVSDEDIVLSVEVNEQEEYYLAHNTYTVTATAKTASGDPVPMKWMHDIVSSDPDGHAEAHIAENDGASETTFAVYSAGEYMIRSWAQYMPGSFAETEITIVDSVPTFNFYIDADPAGYLPSGATNNITLRATVSFGDEALDETKVYGWAISGNISDNTVLTDNKDGTASLYVSSDETENLTVSVSYDYEGEKYDVSQVIPNHPPIRSAAIYDENDNHLGTNYTPGEAKTIELTAYYFPEYTGMVQPIEDAYTGAEERAIASHVTWYTGEAGEEGYTAVTVDGVTVTQDPANFSKVTVAIDETATESFSVVCHIDGGYILKYDVTAE